MNITVDRKTFLDELQLCAAIAPRKSTIPILQAVKLEAAGGCVRLSATDLDLTILTSCAATVEAPGALAIDAQVLLEMVRSLDGETCRIALDGATAVISDGNAKFETPCRDADDFPVPPQTDGEAAQTLELATLQAMLKMTADALGEEVVKFTSTRSCIKFGGEVKVSAVQGCWLAEAWTVRARETGATATYGLSKAAGYLLGKFEATGNAEACITEGADHLAITVDHRTLLDRRVDVRFPDYDSLLPKITDRAVVNRETLLAILARANVAAKDAFSKALRLTFAAGTLGVYYKDKERGTFSELMPIEFTGEQMVVAYNGGYLTRALRLMASRAVELGLARSRAGSGHLTVTPVSESDIHQRAVVMGMEV